MSDDEPQVQLPEEITLTLEEAGKALERGSCGKSLETSSTNPKLTRGSRMHSVTPERLTVPETARRLGIAGEDVYRMIFSGELGGSPDPDDGGVYVQVPTIEACEKEHAAAKR